MLIYAAAATVEYLLSDEGQINRAEGYARPIRSDVELPAELSAKMIPDEEYTNTIPLTDNDAVTAAPRSPPAGRNRSSP